jgi:uncharacterized protein
VRYFLAIGLVASLVPAAFGDMVISEWMYSGTDGEFIEFTNNGSESVDMTGWSYDDDSQTPGTVDLSGFGVVAPGESVLLTEVAAADFATAWGLTGVVIIGDNAANLGRNDQINLYDAEDSLVDRLTFGDQTYTDTIRAQNASGNIPLADYAYSVVQTSWVLATADDDYDSWTSAGGDIGSPGTAPADATEVTLSSLISGACGLGAVEAMMVVGFGLMLMRGRRGYGC